MSDGTRMSDGTEMRGGISETLGISLPLAFAMAAGAANHLCDRLFLAKYGDVALAASLPAMMVPSMFVTLISTMLGYSAVFVSQFHGGGRGTDAVRAFAQGLWLTLFALPLFVMLVPACHFVIDLAGHAEAVAAAEKAYITVYAPVGLLTVVNLILGGVITGQGRTLYVSFATFMGCLMNLALDPLFIFGIGPLPALGLTGAAVAFACASATTTALLLVAVVRDRLVREASGAGALAFDARLSGKLLLFGFPAGFSAFTASIVFTIFTLVVGRLDPLSSAASNTVFAVNNVFFLALCATSDGVRILTGRYHGAGDDTAASRVYYSGLKIVFAVMAVCFAVALPGAGLIMDLFRGAESAFDPEIYRRTGFLLFSIMFFREIAEAITCISVGALRGVGDTWYVLVLQSGVDVFLWLPLIFLVYRFHPTVGALWLTMPVALGLMAALMLFRWRCGGWRKGRLVGD